MGRCCCVSRRKHFFACHGLHHWWVHWLPVGEGVTLVASPCIILRARAPTTGSTGPRVGGANSRARNKHVFHITRVVPLVVPRVTRGQGYGSHGLSLRTGSTGPRVPLPRAEQNVFRMARLAPLVGPLVTRGRGSGPHRLSLHYIARSGADHGFHGPTGWGCKLPGEEQTRFSHSTASTTGRPTGYPWARIWLSWPLPALYCEFGIRPRVPLVHGLGL